MRICDLLEKRFACPPLPLSQFCTSDSIHCSAGLGKPCLVSRICTAANEEMCWLLSGKRPQSFASWHFVFWSSTSNITRQPSHSWLKRQPSQIRVSLGFARRSLQIYQSFIFSVPAWTVYDSTPTYAPPRVTSTPSDDQPLPRVHSHAPSIRSHRGTKVVWPDF